MMETLFAWAPLVGLLFFFCVFVGIAIWTIHPAHKVRLARHATIPLKEEVNER